MILHRSKKSEDWMKKKLVVLPIALVILGVASVYEWRYSKDMQEHISDVNRGLQMAQIQSAYSTGLIGSLQAMTAATDVGGEIISTHDHVHTIKDEVLAWKIKKAVEESGTVGEAIQRVIVKWQESV
jgi:hypothetical protein